VARAPAAASTLARRRYDLRDVFEKKLPTSGRSAVVPHWGQAAPPFSCWLIDIGIVTSRWHRSQKYS
jgi:hypothetical protein